MDAGEPTPENDLEFRVRGMRCEGCARSIERGVGAVPGVASVHASHTDARVLVRTDRDVDRGMVEAAIEGAGTYRVEREGAPAVEPTSNKPDEPGESLYPLALIVGFILSVVLLVAWRDGQWSAMAMMGHFMAGFFLVFSFFKLLDLRGFVSTYRTYDLIAARVPAWGWMYPFVELALGVSYLVRTWPIATNVVTLVLMGIGAVGVLRALRSGTRLRCACLGTALDLPMTTVTLVEDVAMALMAAAMLAVMLS